MIAFMLNLAIANSRSYLICRVVDDRVLMIRRNPAGKERILSSRRMTIQGTEQENMTIHNQCLDWMVFFTYDRTRKLFTTLTAENERKKGDKYFLDARYDVVNLLGKRVESGIIKGVPAFGDQVFGHDIQGPPCVYSMKDGWKFDAWTRLGSREVSVDSLPKSLQLAMVLHPTDPVMPRTPGQSISPIGGRPELIPVNEAWKYLVLGPTQNGDLDGIRTSQSSGWQTNSIIFSNQAFLKKSNVEVNCPLAKPLNLVQACQWPYVVGSRTAGFYTREESYRKRSLRLELGRSELYELNVSTGDIKMLCEGITAVQL